VVPGGLPNSNTSCQEHLSPLEAGGNPPFSPSLSYPAPYPFHPAPPAPFPIPHPAFNFTIFGPTFTTSGQGKAYIIHLSFVKCNGALSDSQPKLIRIGDFVSLTTTKEHSEPNMGGHRWEMEGQLEQRRGGGGLSQLAPWGLGKGKQHLQLTTQIAVHSL